MTEFNGEQFWIHYGKVLRKLTSRYFCNVKIYRHFQDCRNTTPLSQPLWQNFTSSASRINNVKCWHTFSWRLAGLNTDNIRVLSQITETALNPLRKGFTLTDQQIFLQRKNLPPLSTLCRNGIFSFQWIELAIFTSSASRWFKMYM